MQVTLKFLYLLSLTFWIGSIFFFSLITAPSIFKVLPRDLAGDLVSDIFPKYYLIAYICGGIALITSSILWFKGKPGVVPLLRIVILLIMLGLAVYAGGVIRPQALEARAEMKSLAEDSPRYREVHDRFQKLHKRSVIMNSTVFLMGIAIVLITAYTNKE